MADDGKPGIKKKRAPRVAAPGARRLVLTGVMAVPDDFGRLRLLLTDRRASGAPDTTWALLRKEAPRLHADYHVPYEVRDVDADGLRGEVHLTAPAHRRAHWLKTAEELRGRESRAEVVLRPYSFTPPARARGASKGGETPRDAQHITGVAFDIAMLEMCGADGPAAKSGVP